MPILSVFVILRALRTRKGKLRGKGWRKSPPRQNHATAPLDVRAAREKVVQPILYNLNGFIDKLGRIAQEMDAMDQKLRKVSRLRSCRTVEANKQKLWPAVQNLKAGLSTLETDFRTKAVLQKYLPSIQGIDRPGLAVGRLGHRRKIRSLKEPLREAAPKTNRYACCFLANNFTV